MANAFTFTPTAIKRLKAPHPTTCPQAQRRPSNCCGRVDMRWSSAMRAAAAWPARSDTRRSITRSSQQIGELKLLPALREQTGMSVAATGAACRMQILQGTGTCGEHPVVLSLRGIGKSGRDPNGPCSGNSRRLVPSRERSTHSRAGNEIFRNSTGWSSPFSLLHLCRRPSRHASSRRPC